MATRRIKAILEAQDRASPVFSRLGKQVAALGAIAATVGLAQIGRKLVAGMQDAVKAAGVQEAAEIKLAQSLRLTGQDVEKQLPRLKQYAAALQDVTGAGDETILTGQALLVTMGKLSGDGLERATEAALDMAAITGNVEGAFDLVAKAATGYTSTLSRYGIIIDENIPKSEKFEAALDKITELFGGQAKARLETYEGSVQALQGRIGDLQEAIGGPLSTVLTSLNNNILGPLIKNVTTAVSESDAFGESIFVTTKELSRFVETAAVAAVILEFFGEKGLGEAAKEGNALQQVIPKIAATLSGFPLIDDILSITPGTFVNPAEWIDNEFLPALTKLESQLTGLPAFSASFQAGSGPLAELRERIDAIRGSMERFRADLSKRESPFNRIAQDSVVAGKKAVDLSELFEKEFVGPLTPLQRINDGLAEIKITGRESFRELSDEADRVRELWDLLFQAFGRKDISVEVFRNLRAALVGLQGDLEAAGLTVSLEDAGDAAARLDTALRAVGIATIPQMQREAKSLEEAMQAALASPDLTPGEIELIRLQLNAMAADLRAAGISVFLDDGADAAGRLDLALQNIGLTTFPELTNKASALETAATAAIDALEAREISQERYDSIAEAIGGMAEALLAAGVNARDLAAALSLISPTVLSAGEALSEIANTGLAEFRAKVRSGQIEIKSLGDEIKNNVGRVGVQQALRFGDALVDAAMGGSFHFKTFFKQLLADLAKAIVQALILQSILGGLGIGGFRRGGIAPGAGTGAGFSGGSIAPGAHSGMLVPGADIGRDSRLIAVTPGEAILPRPLTDMLMQVAQGGVTSPVVEVHLHGASLPKLIGEINTEVQAGTSRLVASRLTTSRAVR